MRSGATAGALAVAKMGDGKNARERCARSARRARSQSRDAGREIYNEDCCAISRGRLMRGIAAARAIEKMSFAGTAPLLDVGAVKVTRPRLHDAHDDDDDGRRWLLYYDDEMMPGRYRQQFYAPPRMTTVGHS